MSKPEGQGVQRDVQLGVNRARDAQPAWAAVSVANRLECIRAFRRRVAENPAGLAGAATSAAHPLCEVLLGEVLPLLEACRFLERSAERVLRATRLGRRGRPMWLGGVRTELRREAFGVVAVISPSNYPLFLAGVQVVQALVAGNAVVWKPAPGGGAVARQFAALLQTVGLPDGLLCVLPEVLEAGRALVEASVDKVVFTGGFANGTRVLAALASRAIPAVAELSGCDAVFVLADADLSLVAKALRFGLTFNRSRTCMAPRRVFVQRTVAGALEAELSRELSAFASLNWASEVPEAQLLTVVEFLEDARRKGARFAFGGLNTAGEVRFPCVVADASSEMKLVHEDAFAPVLSLIPVDSPEAALEAAARCEYALAASVFTRNLHAANVIVSSTRAGLVSVNDLIFPSADPRVPFGGTGRSGYGVTRGAEGLLELTRIKVVQERRGGSVQHLEAVMPEPELISALIRATHGNGWRSRLAGVFSVIRLGAQMRKGKTVGEPA